MNPDPSHKTYTSYRYIAQSAATDTDLTCRVLIGVFLFLVFDCNTSLFVCFRVFMSTSVVLTVYTHHHVSSTHRVVRLQYPLHHPRVQGEKVLFCLVCANLVVD